MAEPPPTAESPSPPRRSSGIPLHTRILIGLVVGGALGLVANGVSANAGESGKAWFDFAAQVADPVGRIFLRLVLMAVVPLVFTALVLGVYEIGDVRRLGRLGLRTLGVVLLLSTIAVVLGVGLVNILQPGKTLSPEKRDALKAEYADKSKDLGAKAAQAKSLKDLLLDIVPENPLQEMVGAVDGSSKGNGMLAVMAFSLIFGVALTSVGSAGDALVETLRGVFAVTMAIIQFAMFLAPFCVGCLFFSLTARMGFDVIQTLAWFVGTVLLGLTLHMVVVYSAAVYFIGGRSPLGFFRDVREAMLTAFGTASSNATLPVALRVAEQDLKLPPSISTFVLTVGATGNQNGTALYEGVVVLFLAQVFGVELTLFQQVTVVLMSILAGVGTAGVPGGSLPLIVIVLKSVGVPGEGIGLILGVDRLLDMCRTVLNVTGDLVVATCVARGEKTDDA
ncbi:MAG: dicarboxylate/amino acid:cation symporter [Planctomycetia bacterium]